MLDRVGLDMWGSVKGALGFILMLALLPLMAVFLLKLLILAGAWTLASLDEPLYAITAGTVFLAVLAIGIWLLVEIASSNASVRRQSTPPHSITCTQPSDHRPDAKEAEVDEAIRKIASLVREGKTIKEAIAEVNRGQPT